MPTGYTTSFNVEKGIHHWDHPECEWTRTSRVSRSRCRYFAPLTGWQTNFENGKALCILKETVFYDLKSRWRRKEKKTSTKAVGELGGSLKGWMEEIWKRENNEWLSVPQTMWQDTTKRKMALPANPPENASQNRFRMHFNQLVIKCLFSGYFSHECKEEINEVEWENRPFPLFFLSLSPGQHLFIQKQTFLISFWHTRVDTDARLSRFLMENERKIRKRNDLERKRERDLVHQWSTLTASFPFYRRSDWRIGERSCYTSPNWVAPLCMCANKSSRLRIRRRHDRRITSP